MLISVEPMLTQSPDPYFLALEGILRIVNRIFTAVETLGIQSELRQELNKMLHEGEGEDKPQLNELKAQYKAFVDRYLAVKQPFHWNTRENDNSCNVEQDIAQYLELVEFCTFIGDKDILKKWGLQTLVQHNGSYCLADIPSYYVPAFQNAKSESPPTVRPYLEWLIQQFEQMSSS